MKYIDRWALMRNNREENLCEHCLEVSMIAHALATIGNVRYGKTLNAERAALIGLYHDASEIITGDMPTPVKYYNDDIKTAFKDVEDIACHTLLDKLPGDLRPAYEPIFFKDADDENDRYLSHRRTFTELPMSICIYPKSQDRIFSLFRRPSRASLLIAIRHFFSPPYNLFLSEQIFYNTIYRITHEVKAASYNSISNFSVYGKCLFCRRQF